MLAFLALLEPRELCFAWFFFPVVDIAELRLDPFVLEFGVLPVFLSSVFLDDGVEEPLPDGVTALRDSSAISSLILTLSKLIPGLKRKKRMKRKDEKKEKKRIKNLDEI